MKTKQQQLTIGGVQKTSLIDYPGHISTVIFTRGCNFVCPYCHNPELIATKKEDNKYIDNEKFLNFLEKRKELLDGVSITGGEPLLQDGLNRFIEDIKEKGFKVKLDTNGSQPEKLKTLLANNLIDYIAMDVKMPFSTYNLVLPDNGYNSRVIKKIKSSISLILSSGIEHEFRTTVVPGMHENKDIKKIARAIKGAKRYFIQNFRPDNTLNSEMQKLQRFTPVKLQQFKAAARKTLTVVKIRD